MRDVEAVVAAEGEQEVVAGDARDFLRLEAEQLADAVVLVDDVIARAKVGERLERAADSGGGARLATEDLGVGEQGDAELAPDEAAARRRDRVEELGFRRQLIAFLEEACFDPAEQVLVPHRLAAVREGDDDSKPGTDEGAELVLGLGEPPGGDRRALGLEGKRLSARERIELGGACERLRRELLLFPELADCVGLPDDVRRAVQRRDEVVGNRNRLVLVDERRLDQVAPSLQGRIDHRPVDRMQGPLRERREGADRLDLVAEELDPERLAACGREDVDDPTPHCELAALFGALDALVAGEREALRQVLRVVGQADRLGALWERRHALGESRGRHRDETAGREHVQGPGTLADEVRRRVEPRFPADAATREQRDAVRVDEPRCRLGRITRVRVLGEQDDDATIELAVERRQEEGQRGLGHTSSRPAAIGGLDGELSARCAELVEEALEAVAPGELPSECVQYRLVHDESRNGQVPGR